MLYKKSDVHTMILFNSHLQNKFFIAMEFWKFTLLSLNPILQSNFTLQLAS